MDREARPKNWNFSPKLNEIPVQWFDTAGLAGVCWMNSGVGGSCSQGGHVLHSPQGVMFSKHCSPNQVMGGRRTYSVSALLLVVSLLAAGTGLGLLTNAMSHLKQCHTATGSEARYFRFSILTTERRYHV